ncbi:hypothetical protein GGTG_11531 [Gaeumannomyces tritici R3-111a-1]|uniref:Uncharacterized protein n=1 Tax=Gaeumannomyces tritici (strain R3-111a-1) TaxID=644352 RepID=J3PDG0_GAET3|nr:hypothetical protein GGTG_11531 [Gaeumannomyces tritici R3-111a-1]EJT70508.1 hypothetical protein GGTG_11531 [Gaeumannomyces tritici R3-111a-1]
MLLLLSLKPKLDLLRIIRYFIIFTVTVAVINLQKIGGGNLFEIFVITIKKFGNVIVKLNVNILIKSNVSRARAKPPGKKRGALNARAKPFVIKSDIEYKKHFNKNVSNNNIAANFNFGIFRKITEKLYRGRGIVREIRFANGFKFSVSAAFVLKKLNFPILSKVLITHRKLKRLNVMLFTQYIHFFDLKFKLKQFINKIFGKIKLKKITKRIY